MLSFPLSARAADTDVHVEPHNDTDDEEKPLSFPSRYRTTNSLGQALSLQDGKGRFNKQDCIDKETVNFNLTIDLDLYAYGNEDVVLYVGSACKTTPSSPRCTVVPVTHSGKKTVSYTLSRLFGANLPCTGTGDESVWLGPSEEGFNWIRIDTWSDPLIISYDMDDPGPPTLTDLGPGDKKFTATWSEGVTSSSIYVLYYPYPGQTVPVDQEPESPADSADPVDTSDLGDGGDDVDAGGGTAPKVLGPMFAVSAEKDTEPAACPSDTGDVRESDPFDPTGKSKYKVQTGNKGTDATVKDLTNNQAYIVGLVTRDNYNNYSTISNTLCVTPGETDDFFSVYKEAGGEGGKFCFVATAAFGSYDHPAVQLLRMFRDRFLARLPHGEAVIAAYYRVGPAAAAAVEHHPVLRAATAGLLAAFAGLTVPLSLLGPVGSLLALLFVGAVLIGFKLRVKSKR